jgi:hypothetical protein
VIILCAAACARSSADESFRDGVLARVATDGTQLRLVVETDSEIIRNIRAMIELDRPEKRERSLAECVPDFTYRLEIGSEKRGPIQLSSWDLPRPEELAVSARLAGTRQFNDGTQVVYAVVRVHSKSVKSLSLVVDSVVVDHASARVPYTPLAHVLPKTPNQQSLEVIAETSDGRRLSVAVPTAPFNAYCSS